MRNLKDFEITGFVNFPQSTTVIKPVDCGVTLVYIIAFQDGFSNLELPKIGNFCGDDVISRLNRQTITKKIEEIVSDTQINDLELLEDFYFKDGLSFPVVSSVLIGWSKFSMFYTDRLNPWCCGFRDLTNEGKKLYYSLKKLHNTSEIRILTFNNIKK